MTEAEPTVLAPGAIDFWRSVWISTRSFAANNGTLVAIAFELAMIVAHVALRTGDSSHTWMVGWTAVLAASAIGFPTSALVILLALVPFSEWLVVGGVGLKVVIVALIGVGVVIRLTLSPPRRDPGWSVRLAVMLLAATAGSVLVTMIRTPSLGSEAVFAWLAGVGGGSIVLIGAWHAAMAGTIRHVVVAISAVVVGAAASLLDFTAGGVVRASEVGWLLRPLKLELPRVTGIIPAPNAVATVLLTALAVISAFLIAGDHRQRRIALAPLAALLVITIALTYSRSGLVGMFAIVLILVAARRPQLALVLLCVGAIVAILAVPAYLRFRAAALGSGEIDDLATLFTGDAYRFEGWIAAIRMWLAAPFTGFGMLSFRELAPEFGSTYVTAPHNELLRLLAEGGIGVGAVFVAFAAMTARTLWRRRTPLSLGALGSLVGLLIGGMFNNPFIYVQVTAPCFAVIGAALGRTKGLGPSPRRGDAPMAELADRE